LDKKIFINNQIRASQVRVITEDGQQLGVMGISAAITEARNRGLDLIQVTDKVDPPVCRIADYGKYLYSQQKKEKKIKTQGGELKEIRLGFNISPHDIETKAKQAEKFLKAGDKVKVSMVLRGREKALGDYAKNKTLSFLEEVDKIISIKVERELKREPKGFTIIVSKQ